MPDCLLVESLRVRAGFAAALTKTSRAGVQDLWAVRREFDHLMLASILSLVAGLALLVKGGEWFVAAAVRIARFLRMPRTVIGSTLVSLATTTPELVVSIMAGLQGESALAVGNAVGSCICNIGLILGITAVFKHIDVHWQAVRISLAAMFCAATTLLIMTLDLRLSRSQGFVLISLGAAYFVWDFFHHYRQRSAVASREAGQIEAEKAATRLAWLESWWGTGIQFSAGALVVVFGSRLLVGGAVAIAAALGIPSIVIGLTVVAVGTSLPELVTAITSSRQAVSDLAVGNVLGANIANLTFIVGTAAAINEVTVDRPTQLLNFPAMIGLMLLLLIAMRNDRRISRREGAGLLAAYGLFISAVVLMTILKN